MIGLRLLAALSLTILPGAWVAFARRGEWLPLVLRTAIAGALSPVVVALEFLAMRLVGVSVEATAWSLVAINLPALWLVLRYRPFGRANPASLTQWAFILGIFIAGISVPWYFIDQVRIFYSHPWMHSAIVSQIRLGALFPEEPEVAGLRLAYPWLSHLYWATLGVVLDWAPTRVYPFTNIFWTVWTALAAYAGGRALGATSFASRVGVLWLALGTNAVGAAIWVATGRLAGDIRYTPWLRKFAFFNDMPFALAPFAALVALAVLAVRRKDGRHAALLGAVLGATGAVYPLIYPSALVLAALVPVLLGLDIVRGRGGRMRDVVAYAGAAFAATVSTALVLRVTIIDRATSGLERSSLEEVVSKLISTTIVLMPFLIAVLVTCWVALRGRWRGAGIRGIVDLLDRSYVLLLVAVVPTIAAAALFHLMRSAYNEYKFMFCVTITLAPFIGIAVDRLAPRRIHPTIVVILCGLLLSPMVLAQGPFDSVTAMSRVTAAAEDRIGVHLAAGAEEAGWIDAIRERTPTDTILVAANSKTYLPAATSRSLYAPVVGRAFPGVWIESRENLIELRGYSREVLEARITTVRRLLESRTDDETEAAWTEIRRPGRPVAILMIVPDQERLLEWLTARHLGRRLFEDGSGRVVWFVDR